MRTRFSRTLGAVVLAVVLALACGVAAAAAAQDQVPVIVGAVQSPSSGSYAGSLDATIAVATQDTAQGWYAYAPSYRNNDLAAISLADPTNPTIVGEAGPPLGQAELDGSSTINIFNGIAYVVSKNINASTTNNDNGTGNALSLFNVSTNPAVPQYLGSIADSSDGGTAGSSLFGAYGVTVTTINGRSYALVAAQGCLSGQPCPDPSVGNDLAVIDVTNPAAPTLTGTVANATSVEDLDHPTAVAVSGNYAYVTSFYGQALTVVDISNPASPKAVWTSTQGGVRDTTDFPQPSDVTIQGNYAYVINQNSLGTFTVVDISNPLAPTVVGRVTAPGMVGGYRVRVSGNTAYVAGHNANAITDIDVTVPADPIVISSTVSRSQLYGTSGLDLMNQAGNQYVIASSPGLSSQTSSNYPPFPQATGTISALELESPPANTALPTVTGSTLEGGTLTANVGTWTGTAPLTYSYQWQRCDAQGANCTVLKTPTQTYPVGSPDLGSTLRVVVTASNGAGSATATSATTAVVTTCPSTGTLPAYCVKPKSLTRPAVMGTTKVGQKLVGTPGTWATLPKSAYTSAQTPTTTVQWVRCNMRGARCQSIPRATHLSYRLTRKDQRHRVKLTVTATNRNGTRTASSPASAPVVSSRTPIILKLTVSRQPKLIKRGYLIASIRANVGTVLDVFAAIQIGHSSHWTTGKPTQAKPNRPIRFKLLVSKTERKRVRQALAKHRKVTAEVIGTRLTVPGYHASQHTKAQQLVVKG